MQHANNSCKLGTSRPKCPAILFKTTSINLIILDPKKNPLAQAMVPCNNPVSHLHIICYFAGTNFAQSLVLWQEVVVTALAETAFTEYPPKSLVDFIYGV